MRFHYLYCPKCLYFNDVCGCHEQPHGHAGIEHDDCEKPTNAWPDHSLMGVSARS